MPSFKISQLSELTSAADADFFEIVDDSELTISDKNKRITFENLKLSVYTATRIDSDFPAWNVATTYDSADNPQYVSYNSRLYQFAKSSGTDTGTTPGTDATVWAAVGGVEFFTPPATDAEAAAKTATNRYLTPANLAASGVVDTLYSVDGSLTSNRTVTLGTYTLDINLDSTGTFAIQDAGTDVFTVNASGNVNVQNNELYFGGSVFAKKFTGGNQLVVGNSAASNTNTNGANNMLVFGNNSLTSHDGVSSIIVMGNNSMTSFDGAASGSNRANIVIGHSSGNSMIDGCDRGLIIGHSSGGSLAAGDDNTILGHSSGGAITAAGNTIVGNNSFNAGGGTEVTILGSNVSSSGSPFSLVGIGEYGQIASGVIQSVAVGPQFRMNHNYCVLLGNDATSTAASQFVVGSAASQITDTFFGYGVQHTAAANMSLQNSNITSGTTNTASGSFTIQSGQSTGSADGGSIIFKASQAGASGTTQNAQTTFLTIDPSTGVDIENNELYFGGNSILTIDNTGTDNTIYLGDNSTRNKPTGVRNTFIGAANGGEGVSITGTENTVIGWSNRLDGNINSGVVIGSGARVESPIDNFVLIGSQSSSTLSTRVAHNNCIVLGTGAKQVTTTATGQFVVESNDFYLGGKPTEAGTGTTNISINGRSRTSTTDKSSGTLTITSGGSTGSADGGNILFKISDGGASGTTERTPSTIFELGASKIGMYGVTPTTRATTGIGAATFTANTSGISDDTATWGGYTIGQVVQALQTIGILT